MKILLKNGNIITHEGEVIKNRDLLIENKLISKIGFNLPCEGCEVLDCTDKFIAPGFVAMHTHSPMNIFKGIAEDVNIDDWFNKEVWPYESKMQDEDIYWGTKLAVSEMLSNGITAFADHYFKSDIIARACKELGIKADIAYTIFGFGGDCTQELLQACSFYENFKDDALIKPRMGPHSPYICTENVLKTVIDKAKELSCGIHIHASETKVQVEESKKLHNGKTPFEVINASGGFDIPCIIAHGLWIEENDIKLLNKDTCIAVSPKTDMKLSMGEGNIWSLHEKVNIVSGNDGSASSNTIDVLEEMRLFALVGKCNTKAEAYSLKEIWQILMAGHNFLSFNSGKVQEGYSADLNIFDLNTVGTAPVYNPLAAIIYSAIPAINITHTLINGQFVKKGGKLCFDTKEIVEKASACAKDIYARGKGEAQIYF